MPFISPTNIVTGLTAQHRFSFAQVNDTVVMVNGHDSNYIYSTRLGTAVTLGMSAPGVVTATPGAAGSVNGTVQYRARWADQYTGYVSLGGAAVTATPANQ